MATAVVVTRIEPSGDHAHVALWEGLGTGESGDAVEMPGSADRSAQIAGTFGSGTITIEGSNDGTNWYTLDDPQGVAISTTSAGIFAVSQLTRYIRPTLTGGSGGDVDVHLLLKRR
jgi:hypothetical protein